MNPADYENGLREIQNLDNIVRSASFDYEKEMSLAIQNCPSNLDAYDLVFSITIGILSAVLDTNEKLAEFLDEVHQLASQKNPKSDNVLQELLAKVLHHQGDWMDGVPTENLNKDGSNTKSYVSRAAKKVSKGVWEPGAAGSGPHRIFWGHDIFSIHGDNPFSLLIQEYGIGRGVLQAIRHLVADTCSRQGLPIPLSSYFDYIPKNSDGNIRKNRLLDFCQKYSSEALGKKQCGFNNEVFNHLFSIHMQDVLSTGLVAAGISAYSTGRNITDDIRKVQMRVIGYMAVAYGSAIIGAVSHNGIPFINYPAFLLLTKNVIQMLCVSNQELQKIMAKTERLISEGEAIRRQEQLLHNELVSDLYGTLTCKNTDAGRDTLIDYFEEAN